MTIYRPWEDVEEEKPLDRSALTASATRPVQEAIPSAEKTGNSEYVWDAPPPSSSSPSAKGYNWDAPNSVSKTQRQTLFEKAGEPPQKGEAPLTTGEMFKSAARNFLPSTFEGLSGTVEAAVHPIDTVKAVGQLWKGVASKAFNYEKDPEKKKDTESSLDYLIDHYSNTYGSIDGFKKAFATDPFSILMDVVTIGSLGALAPGTVPGKILLTASKLDPIQMSAKLAGKLASTGTSVTRGLQSAASGVDYSALDIANDVGRFGNSAQREAYKHALSGKANAADIADRLSAAADAARTQRSLDYLQGRAGLMNASPSFADVDAAVQAARQNLSIRGNNFGGFNEAHAAINEAERLVNNARRLNPNLLDQDTLKRALYDMRVPHGAAQNSIDSIAAAVKKSIADVDPYYLQIMENYRDASNKIKDFKTSGAGAGLTDVQALTRALKSLKSDAKTDVLKSLSAYDETVVPMLAGYAAKDLFRGGAPGLGGAAASVGLYGLVHPAAGIASLAGGSPRLSSAIQYGAGRAANIGDKLTSRPVTTSAYYAGRAVEGQNNVDQDKPSLVTTQTAEGRVMPELLSTPMVGAQTPGAIGKPVGPGSFGNAPSFENDFSNTKTSTTEPRNAQNYNPGNIKDGPFAKSLPGYKGSDGTFAIFETPEAGKSALERLLSSYVNRGFNTVSKIVGRYSPVGENSSETVKNYISHVAKRLGVDPNQEIGLDKIEQLVRAISAFEGKEVSATGGRIGRASGGRIMNHASLADRLVRAADKAKKAQSQGTEALLDHSDDAIATALEVANKHI